MQDIPGYQTGDVLLRLQIYVFHPVNDLSIAVRITGATSGFENTLY